MLFFSDICRQNNYVGKRDNTIILAIIACLLWSTVYAVIKIGLQYDSPLHFAGIRFIISGLMILPFTVKPAAFISMIRKNWQIVAWVTFLQILMNYILFYLGLNLVPGALGAVIVGSQPLVTAIIASIMSDAEKLTRRKIVTIISGISGVILISAGRQAFKLGSTIEMLGVVMILGANIATATSNVMVSIKSHGINPLVLSSTSFFTGGIIIYLLAISFEGLPQGPQPAEYWMALLWLSFVSAFAFSLWYRLLQRPHVKVSELNMWKFIIPVIGAVLSWILAPGEKPELLTIAGMIIITVSLLLFYKNGDKYLIRLK
jgi:drug/metabolite transporter (DMT)-like permease